MASKKGYNTELAVTVFTDNIHRAIDSGKMTGAVHRPTKSL